MADISKPFIWAWLALLIAVAVYIRIHGADQYHFNNDEAMHFNVAGGRTLGEVLRFSLYEVHPPLLYLLLHGWMAISADPAFVRGFSLLFGTLTILLYYRIGAFLGDEFTGLCAAALVAFSPGWIIQSYVVRQYAVFLFFLSCALYFYLVWQRNRTAASLLSYSGFASIACLGHFSGILAIFCIAAYETIVLWLHKASLKTILGWALAHVPAVLITLTAYYFCRPTLLNVSAYVDASLFEPITHASYSPWKLLLYYPLNLALYLFSTPLEALLMLLLCPLIGRNIPAVRPFLLLSGIALALGEALYITRAYSIMSPRHDMWTFPFMTLAAAGTLSHLCARCITKYAAASPSLWYRGMAILLLAAGVVLYDPKARFADIFEYQVPEAQWQALSRFADTLGPSDLIVANRDDAILLKNNYPYMQGTSYATSDAAIVMPFRHTRILFSPVNRRFFKGEFLADMLTDAHARGLMKNVDRLVFYQTQWAVILDPDLTLCPVSGKKIIAFAQSNPITGLRPRALRPNYATLTMVPEHAFMELLSPPGNVQGCLRGKHDPLYVPHANAY
jgi:hypothetical protein